MSLLWEKSNVEGASVLSLVGRLDTTTAPELEKELDGYFTSANKLILNFEKLDYISSAGLRVLLKAQKALKEDLVIKHVNESIMEVFEITGFSDFLTIE